MSTYGTSSKRWTAKELDGLMVEEEFRLRGLEATRLDTFVDAAFAFVLTLLVISFDDIPSDYPEMLTAVKRIPGFAASFAVLMMFWLQHRLWSRRYGLENQKTILYSLVLIFVMLVYVYPLRMVFEGMFSNLTGGYLSASYEIDTYYELRMMFVFYSVGFLAMSLLVSQLYRTAMQSSTLLALNKTEMRKTKINIQVWALASSFGVLSVLLALLLPDAVVVLAGYIYVVLILAMRLPAFLDRRRHANAE